jgi:ankyrin repeat protein
MNNSLPRSLHQLGSPFYALFTIWLLHPVSALAQKGVTRPIHEAAKAGETAKLGEILDATPDAWKLKDDAGNPPLHVAAWEGENEAVALLLDRGADIAARGFDEWTAQHLAARGGHAKTCQLLLERGADRDALNGVDRNALKTATNAATRQVLKKEGACGRVRPRRKKRTEDDRASSS